MEERVNLAIIAATLAPKVKEGKTKLLHPCSAPIVGNHLSLTAKICISIKPNQKEGFQFPETAKVIPA